MKFWLLILFLISDACHNKECPFLHIDPESKMRDCPWYDRGFCRHGPSCRHRYVSIKLLPHALLQTTNISLPFRHVRRVLCINYLAGFCPEGKSCPESHPRFELPSLADIDPKFGKKVVITCHYCQEPGHKVN
jgi:cleavage and polyadenylation specificity factor subunit 4